ncbi:MAG: DNA polymerase III delta prime subunit [Clostridiales bacterium 38_11]|nr:MAG: DNA polymerase III delta prime subunit [Clostridiales bacterium 38_11]HBH11650.1 DNA polymerase III subunit delta' [Clostridiales bacterium]
MQYSLIIGQDSIKKHLKQIVESNQISHGYIFEGPKGTGKFDMAKIFAQSILCKSRGSVPCEICPSCIKANSGNHPDIQYLDLLEDSIKRQDIDRILNKIYIKPYESDKKVFIINESQKMTVQAANAFLKTLEEPPEDTTIILTTTNINFLLPTIVSRCQYFRFEETSFQTIEKILIRDYKATETEARLLAGYSKGILQRAIHIKNKRLDLLTLRDQVLTIIDELMDGGRFTAFRFEKYFDQNKHQIEEIIEIMMIWFRDILFYKTDIKEKIINIDKLEWISKHSKRVNRIKCAELYGHLQMTYEDINNNSNYKYAIDHLLFEIQEVRHG